MATEYEDLALLSMIIEAGSFVRASKIQGVTKSKLSRRLDELEARLGVRLIERSSRRFEPTPIGLDLAKRGARIREEGELARQIARDSHEVPQGTLRIACPGVLTQLAVGDICLAFSRRYPQVLITVDSADGTRPVTTDNYDVVVVAAHRDLPDAEHIARPLFRSDYHLVAAPRWLARQGALTHPRDLANLPAICWWEEGRTPEWTLHDAAGTGFQIALQPRLVTNNLHVARSAALQDMGIARLPVQMCREDVERGDLTVVLPDWSPVPVDIYAIYKNRRSLQKAGRQFLDELETGLRGWAGFNTFGGGGPQPDR